MPIEWDAESRQFHLHNADVSYLIRVFDDGSLGGLHFGRRVATGRPYRHVPPTTFRGFSNRVGEAIPLEYPTAGTGDFRVPALTVELADGSTVVDLDYRSHAISSGKPDIAGLPATYVEDVAEADTLEVVTADEISGLEVRLIYTIFRDLPVVARSARLVNTGGQPIRITTAMSASLDLPDADWQFVHLSGAWAREREVRTRHLEPGRQSVGSLRGASSHQHNPFIALERPNATETDGEVYGFSLVYSGNFVAEAEVDQSATARVRIGINPEGFEWTLQPGEEFATPEAVLVCSGSGRGTLSDAYHRLYRERLARGHWRDRPRPVLINNWEATYFDFDADKLVGIASVARDVGIELLVLDDGWFGKRDDDTTSLGDWFVDRSKLPDALDGVAQRIEALGLKFGLWIEPEMISERSDLFATHPDWAIGIPRRPRTESRQQLVLDLSRPEIVDHLFGVLSDVLRSAPISYVKWDMNRYITEPYSLGLPGDRQGEFFHRYILGVYSLYSRLIEAFPEILFESCAGGGGRFDPGLLAFAPQAWTSDQTDAIERLRIQWGTSLAYPLSSMGAHVSAVPNHQIGRITQLSTRAAVAFFGVFGYELDPTRFTADERREVADQVAFYKKHREAFQRGRFVRLRSPFEGDANETAWMVVGGDRRRAVVGYYQILNHPSPGPGRLVLRGLDPAASYRISTWPAAGDELARNNAGVRGGDDLMAIGLFLNVGREETAARGDFWSRLFVLEAE
jgi:alpha-galactosidase